MRWAAPLALATLSGCVLLVGDYGDAATHACRFAGDALGCGACIAAQCGTMVDACCGATGCALTLSALDRCGASSDCRDLFGAIESATATALGACAADKCRDACGASDASAPDGAAADGASDGVVCALQPPTFCSCAVGGKLGAGAIASATCGPHALATTQDATLCCADENYPNAGGCQCAALTCISLASTACECGTYIDVRDPIAICTAGPSSDGWLCCASAADLSCSCQVVMGSPGCPSGYRVIGQTCSATAIGCGAKQRRVLDCK